MMFPINEKGMGLVQVMVSAGITMIMSLALSAMMISQNKQIKYLEQKSEIQDIKNEIALSLSNKNVCGCNLNPSKLIPFDTNLAIQFTNSPSSTISLPLGLRHNCNNTTVPFLQINQRLSSGVIVSNIDIAGLTQNPDLATEWIGRLEVQFSNGITLQHKKISFSFKAETSATAPFSIDNCSVTNNFNQEASCTALGGSIVDGQCILNSSSTCQSLGGVFSAGTCKLPTTSPRNSAECAALFGTDWTFVNNSCSPPIKTPTSSVDCSRFYGVGWTYSSGACVPPLQTEGSCRYFTNGATRSSITTRPGWTSAVMPHGGFLMIQNGLVTSSGYSCTHGRWSCVSNCDGSMG